ncbi:hypothetical protein [Knoellia sp. Soil729]|uniref:hypothetical protein n=1 Tax=Knoellia sp. Soil729 TaxID=1736394 RepID=UPI000A540B71|nr:hypothetical protein [Knoellia sp. Soil729]
MVALIIGMLICVALALAVVAMVAVPARRDGRDLLTPKGEEVVSALKDRQQSSRQRLERPEGDESSEDGVAHAPAGGVSSTAAPASAAAQAASVAPAAPVDPARS